MAGDLVTVDANDHVVVGPNGPVVSGPGDPCCCAPIACCRSYLDSAVCFQASSANLRFKLKAGSYYLYRSTYHTSFGSNLRLENIAYSTSFSIPTDISFPDDFTVNGGDVCTTSLCSNVNGKRITCNIPINYNYIWQEPIGTTIFSENVSGTLTVTLFGDDRNAGDFYQGCPITSCGYDSSFIPHGLSTKRPAVRIGLMGTGAASAYGVFSFDTYKSVGPQTITRSITINGDSCDMPGQVYQYNYTSTFPGFEITGGLCCVNGSGNCSGSSPNDDGTCPEEPI